MGRQAGAGTETMDRRRTALRQCQAVELGHGKNLGDHHASAARIKPGPYHTERDLQTKLFQVGTPGRVQKMEARTGTDVGAADQGHLARPIGLQSQGQVKGLKNQAGGAGGADVKAISPWAYHTGFEDQIGAAERGSAQLGLSDGCRRPNAHQVLGLQAGFGSSSPHMAEMERPAGQQGEGQAGAQDLSAPFALGTIEFNSLRFHTSRRAQSGEKFTSCGGGPPGLPFFCGGGPPGLPGFSVGRPGGPPPQKTGRPGGPPSQKTGRPGGPPPQDSGKSSAIAGPGGLKSERHGLRRPIGRVR